MDSLSEAVIFAPNAANVKKTVCLLLSLEMRGLSGPQLGLGKVQKCLWQERFYPHRMYGGRSVQGGGPGKPCCQCPVLFLLSPWCPARVVHYVPADCCPRCLAGRSLQHPVSHRSRKLWGWKEARWSERMSNETEIENWWQNNRDGREAAGCLFLIY